jgi:hypothetical protein
MLSNNPRTACCLYGSVVPALPRLPLADSRGEDKKMKRVVMVKAGGGGSASAVTRGHDVERWPCSSSSSTPSPAGHGGEGRWG